MNYFMVECKGSIVALTMVTKVLLETLVVIHQFQVEHEISPSIRDIRDVVERGQWSVQSRIDRLKELGYLTRDSDRRRSLRLTQKAIEYLQLIGKYQGNSQDSSSQRKIRFLGEIAAGYLSEPAVSPEFIDFECPDPQTDFSLRVSGDSMIGAGILDGMTAIFKHVPENYEPKPGTIIAAYVEGLGTTLKRFYREGSIVILRPANPNYPDQRIDPCETSVKIQGIWIMTIA
jgi:repressor LexA